VNCYRTHQKSLNFIYPFKFYSNFTNKNVSWLHFSLATQYIANRRAAGRTVQWDSGLKHDHQRTAIVRYRVNSTLFPAN